MRILFPSLFCFTAFASPLSERAAKPVYWLLAGDSTTAPNGGWGDAFIDTTLANGASGHNYGHSGATTASFRAGGDWTKVIKDVGTYKSSYDVYTTIQVSSFGIYLNHIYKGLTRSSSVTTTRKKHLVLLSISTEPIFSNSPRKLSAPVDNPSSLLL